MGAGIRLVRSASHTLPASLDHAGGRTAVARDVVAIVALKLAQVDSISTDLTANVPLLGSTALALPAALDFAVARATISVLEVLVIALVGAKVETVTTDLITCRRRGASADEPWLNAALIRATIKGFRKILLAYPSPL